MTERADFPTDGASQDVTDIKSALAALQAATAQLAASRDQLAQAIPASEAVHAQLATDIAKKADTTALSAYATVVALNALGATKADASAVTALNTRVTSNESAIALKADASALANYATNAALTTGLAGKVNTADLTALAARVATLESIRPAVGSGSVAAGLLGGATVDLAVTLSRAMPNSTYQAFPVVEAPASVLGSMVVTVKAQTTMTVTVTVKNISLLSLGAATVRVLAVAS